MATAGEIITRLNPKTQSYASGSASFGAMTQLDVAAALALIRHEPTVLLLRAKYLHEPSAGVPEALVDRYIILARAQRSALPPDRVLVRLAEGVVAIYIEDKRCGACHGSQEVVTDSGTGQRKKCGICEGTGAARPSLSALCRACKLRRGTVREWYREIWEMYGVLSVWEAMAGRSMSASLRG